MNGIIDTDQDALEIKCHDDYKWAALEIGKLRSERGFLEAKIERLTSRGIEDMMQQKDDRIEALESQQEQIRKIAFEGGGTDHMANKINKIIGEYQLPTHNPNAGTNDV